MSWTNPTGEGIEPPRAPRKPAVDQLAAVMRQPRHYRNVTAWLAVRMIGLTYKQVAIGENSSIRTIKRRVARAEIALQHIRESESW